MMKELDKEQKLQLGIEIVSGMKASAYGCSIEDGRMMALEDTEIDLLIELEKPFEELSEDLKNHLRAVTQREKERLHKQAYFIADIALEKLKELTKELKAIQ